MSDAAVALLFMLICCMSMKNQMRGPHACITAYFVLAQPTKYTNKINLSETRVVQQVAREKWPLFVDDLGHVSRLLQELVSTTQQTHFSLCAQFRIVLCPQPVTIFHPAHPRWQRTWVLSCSGVVRYRPSPGSEPTHASPL